MSNPMACPDCGATFPKGKALFECPNYAEGQASSCEHPHPGQPGELGRRTIFRPGRWRPSSGATCPHDGGQARTMRCPSCFAPVPLWMGYDRTIVIVGGRGSGKTCYLAGLIRKISTDLARGDQLQMSYEFVDEAGSDYWRKLEKAICGRGPLDDFIDPVPSICIVIRFPVRPWWRRLFKGAVASVPVVLPSTVGDSPQPLTHQPLLAYLSNAKGIIFTMDPLVEGRYHERLRAEGKRVPHHASPSAGEILRYLTMNLRQFMRLPGRPINKDLAVVLTKCDQPSVFDPDQYGDLPPQGPKYEPPLANTVSRRVEEYLRDGLDLSMLCPLARHNYKGVSFFAVSAVGTPPVDGNWTDAKPRRVEEPLLWLLHRWGYL